jgi:hypothetical protein
METSGYRTDARWIQNGVPVAGGNGWGNELSQLARPLCIHVDDDDETVYVRVHFHHRVVEWKNGSIIGRIVAGDNEQRNQNKQLDGSLRPPP